MTTILSSNEQLRRALRWISDERTSRPETRVLKLVEEAGLAFDLSPIQQEWLHQTFSAVPAPESVSAPTTIAASPPKFPSRILLATDFSAHAQRAAERALQLAGLSGAPVTLLHAYMLPGYAAAEGVNAGLLLSEIVEAARAALTDAQQPFLRAGVKVETLLFAGSPVEAVLGAIADGDYDLVVMGTHGRTGMRHLFLGSVAERIVRLASCPVLTVH
jgi:nucleotide-binding universal stress UspA family protein